MSPAVGDASPVITPYDLDEALIDATRSDGRARVGVARPPSVAVILGRSSQPSVELHLGSCDSDGVSLRRRRGGGCSVVLDPGNVVVSATTTAAGLRLAEHFTRLSEWLVAGLSQSGVEHVVRREVSDLCLGERKIAGACMYRARDLLLYTVSLLVEPDLSLMDRYLRHPPREPAYRQGRPHGDFVTTIHEHCGITAEQLTRRLRSALEPPVL